jgi:hypothetical protein
MDIFETCLCEILIRVVTILGYLHHISKDGAHRDSCIALPEQKILLTLNFTLDYSVSTKLSINNIKSV